MDSPNSIEYSKLNYVLENPTIMNEHNCYDTINSSSQSIGHFLEPLLTSTSLPGRPTPPQPTLAEGVIHFKANEC